MKKLVSILRKIVSMIVMILAIAFIIIEGRLVFSGDWQTYELPFWGFLQYTLRLLLAIVSFGIGLIPWIKSKDIEWNRYGAISLLGMGIVFRIFATNYIGVLFFGISVLYCMLTLIFYNKSFYHKR